MNTFEPVVEPVVETKKPVVGFVGKAFFILALLSVGFLAGFKTQSISYTDVAPPVASFRDIPKNYAATGGSRRRI